MEARPALLDLIDRRYCLRGASLRVLSTAEGRETLALYQDGRHRYVMRICPTAGRAAQDASVLSFLETHHYPAPRVLPALDGSMVQMHGDREVLITTFVVGEPIGFSPARLRELGEALGRLHALDVASPAPPVTLPAAEMLPGPETAWALRSLAGVEGRLPAHLLPLFHTLTAALSETDHLEDLLPVLIHNDCHPGNAVCYRAEGVTLIDWHGAGLGAAIIDVGFLLVSCDGGSPWTPPLPPDPARVDAVIDGYCRHRVLTPAELDRLPAAMAFRSLVYGAGWFGRVAAGNIESSHEAPRWWARYRGTAELADQARARFALYR